MQHFPYAQILRSCVVSGTFLILETIHLITLRKICFTQEVSYLVCTSILSPLGSCVGHPPIRKRLSGRVNGQSISLLSLTRGTCMSTHRGLFIHLLAVKFLLLHAIILTHSHNYSGDTLHIAHGTCLQSQEYRNSVCG